MTLDDDQIERYSRQIILPEIGGRGQEQLGATRVRLAGSGALARVAGQALAGAGIGHLVLAGEAAVLAPRLRAANSQITVEAVADIGGTDVNTTCTVALAADCDHTELAVLARRTRPHVPLLAAATTARGGWLHVDDGTGACAECVAAAALAGSEDTPPLTALSAGVLGSLLALTAIRIAIEGHTAACGRVLAFDAATAELVPMDTPSRPDCPQCGARRVAA